MTGATVRRYRSASPAAAALLGVLVVVLAAALVPLSISARQNPLTNGAESLVVLPFGAVGFVVAQRQAR